MGIEQCGDIQRPIGEVFSFASNAANLHHFDNKIVEVMPITQGLTVEGTIYQLVTVQFGKRMTVDLSITAYEPNQIFAFRVNSGPVQMETHYTFVGEYDNTKIIGKSLPHPEGIWKVIVPMISIPARKKFKNELNSLKQYL